LAKVRDNPKWTAKLKASIIAPTLENARERTKSVQTRPTVRTYPTTHTLLLMSSVEVELKCALIMLPNVQLVTALLVCFTLTFPKN